MMAGLIRLIKLIRLIEFIRFIKVISLIAVGQLALDNLMYSYAQMTINQHHVVLIRRIFQ